jgi:hypothetical protein
MDRPPPWDRPAWLRAVRTAPRYLCPRCWSVFPDHRCHMEEER